MKYVEGDGPGMRWVSRWKAAARKLRLEVYALYYAYRNPRTPWYAKVWGSLVLAYAFSPIDLIPDFIPVLGYLDDLLVVPLGIAISVKMIPAQVMIDARHQAEDLLRQGEPISRLGAIIVIVIWLIIVAVVIW